MNEHESNLYDLYAGLAMMGLIARESTGAFNFETHDKDPWRVAQWSHDVAEQMLRVRQERRNAKDKEADTDLAFSDSEGREDSHAEGGIKTLKKTKTRSE
jgi:hypothetical protein